MKIPALAVAVAVAVAVAEALPFQPAEIAEALCYQDRPAGSVGDECMMCMGPLPPRPSPPLAPAPLLANMGRRGFMTEFMVSVLTIVARQAAPGGGPGGISANPTDAEVEVCTAHVLTLLCEECQQLLPQEVEEGISDESGTSGTGGGLTGSSGTGEQAGEKPERREGDTTPAKEPNPVGATPEKA